MPRVIQYGKGSIPYFTGDQDDRVFILQKGVLILSTPDIESGETVTTQVKPGEFFGVKSSLGHFPREETVTALTDAVVVALTIPEFEKLFSGNKLIIMKMLQVFSSQLRQIHRKISTILNNVPEDQTTGMLQVAKSFYEEEQYRSCCDVCIKILKRFPGTAKKDEVARLYEDSRLRNERMSMRAPDYASADIDDPSEKSIASIPAFERFAKIYEPDSVIISEFEPGDTFYLIQSGQVQLTKCINGQRKNLDIIKAGEFFGEMAILDNSPRSATCYAKTRVKVLEFSKANFETLMTGNPQMALNLLKLFCKRIYDQKRRFRILTIKNHHARLADVFLMLFEMRQCVCPDGRTVRYNLTVSDVANWAGLNQETTRDELNLYVEKRKIEIYDTHIVVMNIGDMKRIVDMELNDQL